MPYQTIISPCYSCRKESCVGCEHELMRDWGVIHENLPSDNERDNFIENLWREMEDIVFDKDDDGREVLGQPFHGFPVGEFSLDDWFNFVNDHHSKGVVWVYENISPYSSEQ